MITNTSENKLQATNKAITEMKLHALLNLTLYRGELQALVSGHFTSEKSLKNRHPNIQYGGSELGIYNYILQTLNH